MGNTVLTYLRKAKHPNIVNELEKTGTRKWYSKWSTRRGGGTGFTARVLLVPERQIEFAFWFKDTQECYSFVLRRDTFDFDYTIKRKDEKNYDVYHENLAEIEFLDYNDFEAQLFQHSLISNLGMFGVQEAEELIKIRNAYFWRNV